ncbi:MAG: glycosyltransferase [Lachnospiraceae bacterium]|nr:glycosyltransferase [Lachnospiraceae bacterium]
MKKITVMHVLCMSTYSGAENVAITLINSLKDEVYSVYVSPAGPICDVVKKNNIEHYSIEKVSISNINKAITDIEPDIIHAHDFTAGLVCAHVAKKIPVINHLHNNPPWIKKWGLKSLLYYNASKKFNSIITVSQSVMDEYIFGKKLRQKTKVIGNPIDLQAILTKAENSAVNEESDIIFLGRLMTQKNPLFFIEIVVQIVKLRPDIKVAIVGDGDLRMPVEKKIEQYNLRKNIKLYGFQENPYGILKNSKVLCIPSIWEGFGLVAVEALTFGKPVVAANVGGLPTIVNSQCGVLCEGKNEYVDGINTLISDRTVYEKKSKMAMNRAKEIENIKWYRDSIMRIYKSAL